MNKILEKKTVLIFGVIVCMACFSSCNKDKMYEKEMYHPVLYLLSSGTDNVYTVVVPFKESDAKSYFSVGCGGSLPNPEEVVIELERDTILYDKYNRKNFDNESKYARLLPSNRYEISSDRVVLPANSPDQYVKVPVKINQQGLSPDSIYFIPIAIKSVSKYEVNPDKYNMLFRVAVENDYAEQVKTTVYYQRGTSVSGNSTTVMPITGSKMVYPLSIDEVRMFAGVRTQTAQTTVAEINKYSIVVRIAADSSTTIRPYGTIEVEQLEDEAYNRYYTITDVEGKSVDYIDLYYRFRTLNSTDPDVYSDWTAIRESLQRMN
jgi:hypothetical protein